MRVLRVPRSGQALRSMADSAPDGSTKTCTGALDLGVAVAGARGTAADLLTVVARVAGLRLVDGDADSGRVTGVAHIMRFSKSAWRALRWSRGSARLAIPNLYTLSAS